MSYVKAVDVLPEEILALIQNYIDGEYIYYSCGQNCAKYGVLKAYQELYEKCSGNMDEMYLHMYELGDVEGKIIKSNSEYEITFPKCLCPLYQEGYLNTPSHCECSRNSILYVMNTLFPHKNVEVKMVGTVLGGYKNCKFKVHVLDK